MNRACALAVFFVLCELSRQDLEDQTIDGAFLLLPVPLGLLVWAQSGQGLEAARFLALLPGMLLAAIALLNGGDTGEGDGLCFWSLGYLLPPGGCFFLMTGSMLLAGLSGLAGMLCCRDGRGSLREKKLPLFPYITFVYALELMAYAAGSDCL